MPDEPILRVRGLKKYYPVGTGAFKRVTGQVRAVDDVSFDLARGEVLGLVGEAGPGKTTLGRCLIRAIDPTAGEVILHTGTGAPVDLATAGKATLRGLRAHMNMVFQDPFLSLSPRISVRDIIAEPLRAQGADATRIAARVAVMYVGRIIALADTSDLFAAPRHP